MTLWVPDGRQGGLLLETFYRQLDRKASPAEALRRAQLKLLREGQPPHAWAGFVLTGRY
jgi:CHAT domain-containing protein